MSTDESSVETQSFGAVVAPGTVDSNPVDGGPAAEAGASVSPSASDEPQSDPAADPPAKTKDTFDPYRFGRIQFSTQAFRRLLAIPLPEVPEEDLIRKGEASLGAIPIRPMERVAPLASAKPAGAKPRVFPLFLIVLAAGGLGGFLLLRARGEETPVSTQEKSLPTPPKAFKVTLPRSQTRTSTAAEAAPVPSSRPPQESLASSDEVELDSRREVESSSTTQAQPERSPAPSSGKPKASTTSKSKAWFEVR